MSMLVKQIAQTFLLSNYIMENRHRHTIGPVLNHPSVTSISNYVDLGGTVNIDLRKCDNIN